MEHAKITSNLKPSTRAFPGRNPGTGQNRPSANNRQNPLFSCRELAQAFGPDFLNQDFCCWWILRRLHPAGPTCPHCGAAMELPQVKLRFWQGRPVVCCHCGREFTAKTGTILAGVNMKFNELALLAYLLARGDGDIAIARALGRSRETVRLWRKRFEASE